MILLHRIPHIAILCVFLGAIQQVRPLGRGGVNEESDKKWRRNEGVQSKKWCPSHKFFYVLFSVTQSLFLLGFSWSLDSITASNKKNTSKKEPTSVSEVTTIFAPKKFNSTNLSMWVVYATSVSKNSVMYQDVIFTSFDTTWYAEAAIYAKHLLFSLSIVSFWSLVNNTGEVLEWNWKSVMKVNGVKNAVMEWHTFWMTPY